jgi:hypothetical protein
MQVVSPTPAALQLRRKGGSIVTARLDFWSATPAGWQLAGSSIFQNVTAPSETQHAPLPKGQYTAVFTCRVEESINGVYDFHFDVGPTAVYADSGNVNTTSDPHDSKVYKDQFVLDVV